MIIDSHLAEVLLAKEHSEIGIDQGGAEDQTLSLLIGPTSSVFH